jgi:quercetin 2,3-dioxygenase
MKETQMITIRQSADRGHSQFDWLDSHHSFSFGQYQDQRHMGFSDLCVINQDVVAAGKGFNTHGHANMEIISYVLRGAVEHKDSLGTIATIVPGEIQRMTAGTGIRHSEYNPSQTEPTEFLQIWIMPEKNNLVPGYEQKYFGAATNKDALQLVASRDGRDGSILVHQDVLVYRGLMTPEQNIMHPLGVRKAWLQVVHGTVDVDHFELMPGDGAAIDNVADLSITAKTDAEFLLFSLRP